MLTPRPGLDGGGIEARSVVPYAERQRVRFGRLRERRTFATAVLLGIALHALAHVPLIASGGLAIGVSGMVVAAIGFPAMAYLYERGSNTI